MTNLVCNKTFSFDCSLLPVCLAPRHNGKGKATYDPPHKSATFYPWGWRHPPQPAPGGTVVIVGDECQEDKWTEYTDKDGNVYYHNPARPKETTWDKPEDFDNQKNEGKPVPPTTKPPKKKKKYDSDRKGLL